MNNNAVYIDATTINEGGGFVLLEYFIDTLINLDIECFVIGNSYLKNKLSVDVIIPSKCLLLKLYTVGVGPCLYFCNRGPIFPVKNSCVYLHTEYAAVALSKLFRFPIPNKRKLAHFINFLFNRVSYLFSKNQYFVQTERMRNLLIQELNIDSIVAPFFSVITEPQGLDVSIKRDFCYVSYPWPHKNYDLLFNALLLPSDSEGLSFAVTIPDDGRFSGLLALLEKVNSTSSHVVENLGVISKMQVAETYLTSRAALFLSSRESFGLPLIEAASLGRPVVAPDLEYVNSVLADVSYIDIKSSSRLIDDLTKYAQDLRDCSIRPSRVVVADDISRIIDQLQGR
ncbi:MAG: glycosyltransferase [Gammaproteobacteria bacterium]|nr:glycosyltransferase [Gammaproteobacteria bacterium]MBQ0840677.1 glycosyltransferase [Gammaproteobacteria bacterium]